jgi:S-adenosylmethionine:tRNA ribosyltransferase-isomerase
LVRTDELDFDLPSELIAQTPAEQRASARLLHYRSTDRSITHRKFSDLPSLLRAGDVLVFNDTRVIPARFMLKKITGGKIDALYLGSTERGEWRVMLKNLGPIHGEVRLTFGEAAQIAAIVLGKEPDGTYRMRTDPALPPLELLERVGRMPLPPYIRRKKDADARDVEDRERYQTVYAAAAGSVAAPTAGLHFTEPLLRELDAKQIERVHVTLHVGMGTFKPVTAETLAEHQMHAEEYSIDARAADRLNHAKREGRRIIAVGTTAARVLESQQPGKPFESCFGQTQIFIYPPYQWRHVGALITNFHLPRSTLIALVAAKVGIEEQRRIYREAIAQRYRFFSYGDASFLE